MWQERAFERIPWQQIKSTDGTSEVLRGIEKLYYRSNAHSILEWFLRPDVQYGYCLKRNDDVTQRTQEYLPIRDELAAMDVQMDEASDGGDFTEQTENRSNATDDVEGVATCEPDDVEDTVPEWTPPQIYETTARHLACFVGKVISYMVIETRGKQHFATPRNRVLQKSVFQDLQHFEQGEDQGNRAYGAVYDLWIEQMKQLHPDISIPQRGFEKAYVTCREHS